MKKTNKNGRIYSQIFHEWPIKALDDAIYFVDRMYSPYREPTQIEVVYKEKVSELLNDI